MPSETTAIEKPTLLIVEGKEDRMVLEELSKSIELTEMQILPIGGKTQLERNLRAGIITPGFDTVRSIGIVRDGDDDPQEAFEKVCQALAAVNLPVPHRPLEPVGENPKVSVFITPDGTAPGMLEDICLSAVLEYPAASCVEDYFRCLAEKRIEPRSNVLSKAKIHVFLASHERPDLRLGEAAQNGYFSWEHPAFESLKGFLRQIAT